MWVYAIIIRLYFFVILCASPFNSKAKKWIEGRWGWRRRLNDIDFSKDKWVWFHCSSFGEFQDGKSLMEAFARAHPEFKILLTFFSSTGFELQRDYQGASAICYLPLDRPANAAFFLDTVKPRAAFFIRHDIWPNYVTACYNRNIPAFLVSFTLNISSSFLKFPLRGFYRKIFLKYTRIFVQYSEAGNILKRNGFSENMVVSGNSRIDRIVDAGKENRRMPNVEQFVSDSFCCIAGSTHTRDREIFLEAYQQLKNENIKWILVPHEIDEAEISKAKSELKDEMAIYSKLHGTGNTTKLLWIDQVGMLGHLYRCTSVAFVGGGFGKAGIHNILEPALHGCAVAFGPNHRFYREALDLMKNDGAQTISNSAELVSFIMKYKRDRELRAKIKASNRNYVLSSSGATKVIMEQLQSLPHFK